jgi:isopenicillin N synthase-like dioxygenase
MAELVPVVDLAAAGAPAAVDAACRSVGFFSLVGHGVAPDVVDRMLTASDALFALALEEKLHWQPPDPSVNRGYAAKGTEGLTYSLGLDGAPPDLFEAFNIGPPGDDNIWPEAPGLGDLRPALEAYFAEARLVAHRLTGLFARALGLEPDFFVDKTDHSTDTLRVNNYERAAGDPQPLEGQQRMGAHTDYGIVTVLYADRVPGLQIVSPDGSWVDVQPAPGALLVNLGDLLAQWTNDRWRSTIHRVVPPPRSTTGRVRRRSVAFFHDGNADAHIECLPTCCSASNPARYPPVIAGDHLAAKLRGPRTLTASDAVSTAGDRPVV